MENKAIIEFHDRVHNRIVDLEVPLDISAEDLITALNSAYDLQMSEINYKKRYLRCQRPIALLKGHKTLASFGVCSGSVISSPMPEKIV